MKLLLDQNLSFKLCEELRDLFPHSAHVRLLSMDRADDRTIWEYAKLHGYLFLTQDADFAELSALYGVPPKVIWLRCGNQPTEIIEHLLRDHVSLIASFESDKNASCLEIG